MKNILLIGKGNVAFHLKKALTAVGCSIIDSSEQGDFDLVIFSITDDAYFKAVESFPWRKKIMVHTSGSISGLVFSKKTNDYGVIYPYQTINKKDENLVFRNIPLMVTASNEKTKNTLLSIATKLSDSVQVITDEQRLKLHLAAVFANNFTNHMVAIAQKLMKENNLDVSLLQPLLEKTFLRLKNNPATGLQTGPAVRGDFKVIEKHLKMLENHPEWQKIYSFVSKSITDQL